VSDSQVSDWLAIGIGAITAWMAWETRRMASVAKESLLLSQEPYLSLNSIYMTQGPRAGTGQLSAQIKLKLSNPGRVRINYDVESAEFTIGAVKGPVGPYENHFGVIHPGEVTEFFLPALEIPKELAPGTQGTLSFRVRYWSLPEERKSLSFTVEYVAIPNFVWVYKNGPTYA
jgi:hypothetical protein